MIMIKHPKMILFSLIHYTRVLASIHHIHVHTFLIFIHADLSHKEGVYNHLLGTALLSVSVTAFCGTEINSGKCAVFYSTFYYFLLLKSLALLHHWQWVQYHPVSLLWHHFHHFIFIHGLISLPFFISLFPIKSLTNSLSLLLCHEEYRALSDTEKNCTTTMVDAAEPLSKCTETSGG